MSLFKNSNDTYNQGITIEKDLKKYNKTSTVEVQNKQPVTVTSSIKVVSYTFNLSDSTVTRNIETATFKGEASVVKRQIDSVQERNGNRMSDKEAWLKSWQK